MQEKTIPLREIKSIKLAKGWPNCWLVLTAHRLSTLEEFAVKRLNLAEFAIPRRCLDEARELVAQVRARLAALTPRPAGEVKPEPGLRSPQPRRAAPGRLKAFFQSVLYYCADSFQKRQPPSPGQPGTAPDSQINPVIVPEPESPGDPELRSGMRPRTLRKLQQFLLGVYFLCLFCVLSFHGSGGKGQYSFQMGFPSPWWTVEKVRQDGKFRSGSQINLWNWSGVILVVGGVALETAWVLEKRLAARAGRRISSAVKWKWAILLIISLVMFAAGITAGICADHWTL